MPRNYLQIFLGLALIAACFFLGTRVFFALNPDVYHSDAPFYFNVGKGILNGLTPYEDIFESKPAGIFFLSALSFAVTDSPIVGNILIAVFLIALPLLFAWIIGGSREYKATAFLTGGMIVLWASMQAGIWQVEFFGAMFAVFYVLLLANWKEEASWKKMLLAAALLLGAIGFKEPFLLATFAVALVMTSAPRDLLRRFFIPLSIALVAGTIILLLLGWLEPYVKLYLPALTGARLSGYGPLWLRGFKFWDLWSPISSVSVLLPLAILAAVAWYAWKNKQSKWRMIALFLGLYFSIIAVQLGGLVSTLHYSTLLVPLIAAICVRLLMSLDSNRSIFIHSLAVLLVLCTISWDRLTPSLSADQAEDMRHLQSTASRLDRLIKACEVDRYLYAVNPPQPLLPAFTDASSLTHYPYREIDNIQFGMPFLRKTLERLSQARIIVVNPEGFVPKTDLGLMLQQYITKTFTADVPTCASDRMPLEGYGVLFRIDATPIRLIEGVDANGNTTMSFEF